MSNVFKYISHLSLCNKNFSDFNGLKKASNSEMSLIESDEGWTSIGHQVRQSRESFDQGFPGLKNSFEIGREVGGEVTLVEIRVRRNLLNKPKFKVTASSGIEKAHLLNDGSAFCYPDEELYFKSAEEVLPNIEIDLLEPRVVKGVSIYVRVDSLAPSLKGRTKDIDCLHHDSRGTLYLAREIFGPSEFMETI